MRRMIPYMVLLWGCDSAVEPETHPGWVGSWTGVLYSNVEITGNGLVGQTEALDITFYPVEDGYDVSGLWTTTRMDQPAPLYFNVRGWVYAWGYQEEEDAEWLNCNLDVGILGGYRFAAWTYKDDTLTLEIMRMRTGLDLLFPNMKPPAFEVVTFSRVQ